MEDKALRTRIGAAQQRRAPGNQLPGGPEAESFHRLLQMHKFLARSGELP
jgi:hypothetical protein